MTYNRTMESHKYETSMYDQYVFHKILDLGFRIFGGSVRNRIWRSVNEQQRRKHIPCFKERFWDPTFSQETIYNRWGGFHDIDCIGTYEQFAQLTCPEMVKFGDLKYQIKQKNIAYSIDGLEIKEGEIEFFHIQVKPKIMTREYRCTEIDMFICRQDLLETVYKRIYDNLDFECNGLCMQKIQ